MRLAIQRQAARKLTLIAWPPGRHSDPVFRNPVLIRILDFEVTDLAVRPNAIPNMRPGDSPQAIQRSTFSLRRARAHATARETCPNKRRRPVLRALPPPKGERQTGD